MGVAAPADAGATLSLSIQTDPSLAFDPDVPVAGGLCLTGAGSGPLLRIRQGEACNLTVRNDAAEPGGLAVVGMRGWGAADSAAARALGSIAAGGSRTVALMPEDAGTALIRAAPSSRNEAARGASAALIVEDRVPWPADHDVALLLQDWLLGPDGQLRFGPVPPPDAVARRITVNGKASPDALAAAPRARLRLRLVNASVQRAMVVACEGAKTTVIAVDGQPSELFAPARNAVPIAPGARFDLAVDLPDVPGREARVILRGTERLNGILEPDRPLLSIRTDGRPRDAGPPLAPLPPNPALPRSIALETAKRLDLTFALGPGGPDAAWTVNGAAAGPTPALVVRHGDVVVLGFTNASPLLVPMRVQGQAMRVLHARDDGWDPYWRDTVLVPPRNPVHATFVADRPGLWPIESAFDDQLLRGLRSSVLVRPR